MSSFKRTNSQVFSKPRPPVTAENRYWNKLGVSNICIILVFILKNVFILE